MKLLAVADRVCDELLAAKPPPELRGLDLIVSCGDLPPEYLTALRHRFDVPLLYVLGNHDLRYQESPPEGCRLIDSRLVHIQGLRVLGLSGCHWYNGGVNQFSEAEMAARLSRLRFTLWRSGGFDLVVTHAPPRHIHDREDMCHRGFDSYVWLMKKYRPRFFLHGHVHEDFSGSCGRMSHVGLTNVINCYGFHIFEI